MSYRLIPSNVRNFLQESLRNPLKYSKHSFRFSSSYVNQGGKFEKAPPRELQTVGSLLKKWTKKFDNNWISEPQQSIEHILAHYLGTRQISDVYKSKGKTLTEAEVTKITDLCNERLKKKPIQYVIQEWDFRNLILKMRPPVFIPRQETEMLIDLVNEEINKKQGKEILEFCCGSGAISLSILQENPELKAVAVDASHEACKLTKENAEKHNLNDRLEILQCLIDSSSENIFPRCDKKKTFDMIVSNPPYIPTEVMSALQPEILIYEDLRALDGGIDGLDVIKHILAISPALLKDGGKIFLEIDPSQPPLLQSWINMKCPNLIWERTIKDFYDKDRFVVIAKM